MCNNNKVNKYVYNNFYATCSDTKYTDNFYSSCDDDGISYGDCYSSFA